MEQNPSSIIYIVSTTNNLEMENQESKYYCRNFSALNSNMDPTSRNISYSVRRSLTPPPPSYNELFQM